VETELARTQGGRIRRIPGYRAWIGSGHGSGRHTATIQLRRCSLGVEGRVALPLAGELEGPDRTARRQESNLSNDLVRIQGRTQAVVRCVQAEPRDRRPLSAPPHAQVLARRSVTRNQPDCGRRGVLHGAGPVRTRPTHRHPAQGRTPAFRHPSHHPAGRRKPCSRREPGCRWGLIHPDSSCGGLQHGPHHPRAKYPRRGRRAPVEGTTACACGKGRQGLPIPFNWPVNGCRLRPWTSPTFGPGRPRRPGSRQLLPCPTDPVGSRG